MSKLNIINEDKNVPKSTNVYHHFHELKNERWKKYEASFDERYKNYRKRFEKAGKNLTPDLVHLEIEAYAGCNFSCSFCALTIRVQEGNYRKLGSIDFELYKKIIDDAVKVGVCSVNLNFLGEPLMNPRLIDMIKYAKEKQIIDVFLHTNGSLITEKKCHELIDSGLDKYSVSFDDPRKEVFEEIRIGADYEQVLGAIKMMDKVKKERNAIKPLTRVNFIRLPGITDKVIKQMEDLVGDYVDSLALLPYVDPYFYKKSTISENHTSKWACPQLFNRMAIHSNGKLFPCCMAYDQPKDLKLGEFKENSSLLDFWNSKKLQNIRKKHLEGKWFEVPYCHNCEFARAGDTETLDKLEKSV